MTVSTLCEAAGMSPQNYYKGCRARRRREVDEEAVVEMVKRERALQPRLGARKLRVLLEEELEEAGIRMGRDRLFEVLRGQDLLIRRRRRGTRTTDSGHGFRTYPNRYRELELGGAHEAWVSDLTYVRTDEGFVYVSVIGDAWSRKIVGYAAERTLEATGPVRALRMALAQLPPEARPMHHSDRGIQYCCRAYVEALEARGLPLSMTEKDHCYENAQAERLVGILKQEYGLGETFRTRAQVPAALKQAVTLYNTRRPHTSLGYKTPHQVHEEGSRAAEAAVTPVALRAPSVTAASTVRMF